MTYRGIRSEATPPLQLSRIPGSSSGEPLVPPRGQDDATAPSSASSGAKKAIKTICRLAVPQLRLLCATAPLMWECTGAARRGGTAALRQAGGKRVKNGGKEKFREVPLGISMMAGKTFIEVGGPHGEARRFYGGRAFLCDVKGRLGSF